MKLRYFLFTISAGIMLCGCASDLSGIRDCYGLEQLKRFSTPSFEYYVLNVRGSERSRIDIYTQLQYRNLRFLKDGEGYKASYVLRYIVRDSINNVVTTKEADRTVKVRTYEESISPRMDSHLQSFSVEPGRYSIEIESVDELSRFRSHVRKNISATDHSAGLFSASSMLLLNTIIPDERGITLRPVLPSNVSTLTDSIGIFQEVYQLQPQDTVHIIQRYYSAPFHSMEEDLPHMYPPYRSMSGRCATTSDSVYFQSDTSISITHARTIQLVQFYTMPNIGPSVLERKVIINRNEKKDSISYHQDLFRRERNLLYSISLDEELSVLRYILRENEYDSLMHTDPSVMNRRINEYWEERGGAERRKEYLRKAVEANMLFTGCADGLRTPMGIIYIICGVPDGMDCQGDIAENWYYAIGERTYAVQFRTSDNTHRNYDLVPFSMNDILWQYSLDQWRRKR